MFNMDMWTQCLAERFQGAGPKLQKSTYQACLGTNPQHGTLPGELESIHSTILCE